MCRSIALITSGFQNVLFMLEEPVLLAHSRFTRVQRT